MKGFRVLYVDIYIYIYIANKYKLFFLSTDMSYMSLDRKPDLITMFIYVILLICLEY